MAYEEKVKWSTRWFIIEVLKGNGEDNKLVTTNITELWL